MEYLQFAFLEAIQPISLLTITIGLAIGIVAAALPGISGTMAVALLVPITFGLQPKNAILLLCALYLGAHFGGAITAILLKIPGTGAAAATVLDGYPLAQKGYAGKALGVALVASAAGGAIGVLALTFFAPALARVSLKFGPVEYFALAVFGLSIITSISTKSIAKGITCVLIGLFLGTVGLDHITGVERFTFGYNLLRDGIDFVPILIGLFAVGEVFVSFSERLNQKLVPRKVALKLPSLKELWSLKGTILRSSIIGTFIGALPGAGGTIAGFISYNEAIRWSKTPEKFGTGIIEGIAAPESANNAACGGALIPTLALGIPGSGLTAVMMGALLMHGLRPGPLLFTAEVHLIYTVFVGMFLANFIMLVLGYFGSGLFARAVLIPYRILGPLILIFASIGAYAVRGSYMDLVIMYISGVFGYFMIKNKYPLAPMILGLVLGNIAETGLRRGLIASNGAIMPILAKPIVTVLFILSAISFATPVFRELSKKHRSRGNAAN